MEREIKFLIYKKSSEDMKEVKSGSVALVVTSPPYPMIAKWDDLFKTINFKEQHELLNRTFKECYRILIDGGIACINIGDATRSINKDFCCYPNYAEITINLMSIGFTPLIPILWKKISNRPNAFLGSGFLPVNVYISQDCEYIGIYRKGKIRQFNEVEKQKRNNSSFTKEQRDLWCQQIWEIKGKSKAKETSAFPEEIPYRLIRLFSIENDLVVDPFNGTGTTGKISEQLNRKFIGYQI